MAQTYSDRFPITDNEKSVVFHTQSLYSNVYVYAQNHLLCLTFGVRHARQSCIEPATPEKLILDYTQGMMVPVLYKTYSDKILVLGLGGGILPNTYRQFYPNAMITTVELDRVVADVAKKYFNFHEDEHSVLVINDARVFVRQALREGLHFDIIIVDVFDKSYIPEHLITLEFFSQLNHLLDENGILVANSFTHGQLQPHEISTYQAVFGQICGIDMPEGNRILVAIKSKSCSPHLFSLSGVSHAQTVKMRFNVDLVDLQQKIKVLLFSKVKILTDQYSPANLLLNY